jgi:hypothetical protein
VAVFASQTWSGQQTFVAPALGTPASGVATLAANRSAKMRCRQDSTVVIDRPRKRVFDMLASTAKLVRLMMKDRF